MAKIAEFKNQMTQVHVMLCHLKTMAIEQILARYRSTESQLSIELRWLRLSVMWEVLLEEKLKVSKDDIDGSEQN